MRVCFFGTYNPNYSRNKILIEGLKENRVEVLECRLPAGPTPPSVIGRYFSKLSTFFGLAKKLLAQKRRYDVLIVAFPGHRFVWLAKLLTRKKVVFDAFISIYDTYVFDRKLCSIRSLKAKYYWFLDFLSSKLADKVLLDTSEHIKYFRETFGVREEKFKRIFVGADDSIFYPREFKKSNDSFLVHFHGTYIPVQGVEYVIRAAKLLEKENIKFNLIGNGQTYSSMVSLSKELDVKNINFIDFTPQEDLVRYIAQADVCLGLFGEPLKATRAIPNKVYEAIAMKKPIITADSPAVRELFEDKVNCLLCKRADSQDLAEKILELRNNPDLGNKIADNGYQLFKEKLTPKILGRELKEFLMETLDGKRNH